MRRNITLGVAALLAAIAALLTWSASIGAPVAFQQYLGLFKFADGENVFVGRIEELDGPLTVSFTTSRLRSFHQQPPNSYASGPTLGAAMPIETTIALKGDALEWREKGAPRIGQRVNFRREDVTFRNGEIKLSGTLLLPAGNAPFAAVVLAHGAGPQDRNFFFVPEFFAMHGIAVLAYDKRGVGQSSGDWQRASHRDLAGDLVAAIDFLRARRDIAANKIGLYGSSEGGWTAPIAATIAKEKVAWIIARSASGLSNRDNRLYEIENELREHGFGDDAVAAAVALHRQDIAVTEANGAGWNEFRAALARASTQPWFQFVRLPPNIMEFKDANRARIMSWIAEAKRSWGEDPARIWERITCPVLMQIGELDRNVPAQVSAKVIGEALDRAHNRDVTIRIYPRGDHGIFESARGYRSDIGGVTQFVPGYLSDLGDWIDRHAK